MPCFILMYKTVWYSKMSGIKPAILRIMISHWTYMAIPRWEEISCTSNRHATSSMYWGCCPWWNCRSHNLTMLFKCFEVICEYLHDSNVFCQCGSMFQAILQTPAKNYDSDQWIWCHFHHITILVSCCKVQDLQFLSEASQRQRAGDHQMLNSPTNQYNCLGNHPDQHHHLHHFHLHVKL